MELSELGEGCKGAQVVQFMRHIYVVFLGICQIRKSVVDTFVSAAAAVSAIYYFFFNETMQKKNGKVVFHFLCGSCSSSKD